MATVTLRSVEDADMPVFFAHQQDAAAVSMAAFTARDPSDRAAFDAHWQRIRATETVFIRTILVDGETAGHVLSYVQDGETEVSYWIDSAYWGRGVGTRALDAFLGEQTVRPLFARVAADNQGSIRVLEKCGFVRCGEARGFANARGCEIDEYVMKLEGSG